MGNIKDEIALDKLFFGVKLYPMSYTSEARRRELATYNLFDFGRVKHSVALWVTMKPEEKSRKKDLHDQLMWCFGDVWGRTEFEFMISPWPYKEGDTVDNVAVKIDTFSLYVEPNGELLMGLVNQVSVSSAKAYLKEWNRRYKK